MKRGGFTLIEMLVVLVVIGALATVALRSMDGLANRARFDNTQRTLSGARDAIVGVERVDGFEAGFLNDVARLPKPALVPAQPLGELLQIPAGMSANQLVGDAIDIEIALPAGWRGPYLQLAPGSTNVLDGWGNALLVDTTAGVFTLRSLGADGVFGGAGFDTDLALTIIDPAQSIDATHCAIVGSVSVASAPTGGVAAWSVVVYAYEPDSTSGGLVARAEDVDTETPVLTSFPVTFNYRFSGANALTPGARVLRAYLFDTSVTGDPRASALKRSAPRRTTLKSGATQLDLTID